MNAPHSGPVGGGNAPVSWMPAAIQNQQEKKKKRKSAGVADWNRGWNGDGCCHIHTYRQVAQNSNA